MSKEEIMATLNDFAIELMENPNFSAEKFANAILEQAKQEKLNYARKAFEASGKETLTSIKKCFLENSHKAERLSDLQVFEAIADTIENFPLNSFTDWQQQNPE